MIVVEREIIFAKVGGVAHSSIDVFLWAGSSLAAFPNLGTSPRSPYTKHLTERAAGHSSSHYEESYSERFIC